jgi:hypothetical protein
MSGAAATVNIPRRAHAIVLATALVVFGYRGWDARTWLMYLDAVFVKHALAPDVVHGGIRGALDPLGLLNSFSGYVHLVARSLAELFTTLSLDLTPTMTWVTATVVWSGAAWIVGVSVASASSSVVAGVAAAAAFVFHPASNIILLGQLNALQWPMLLACTIVAATAYRPRSLWGRWGIVVLFVATALNAALTFLVIGVLLIALMQDRSRRFTAMLLTATAIPYVLQILTYFGQDARQVKSREVAAVLRELFYGPQIVVPGSLRNGVDAAPETLGLILIVAFWIVMIGIVATTVIRLRRSNPRHARLIAFLASTGVVFLAVSVVLNGNLNHQYLVVPYGCWWSAVAVACSSMMRGSATRRTGQLFTMITVGIFAFAAVPQMGKHLHDPFFVQPYVGDWSSTLESARNECSARSEDALASGSSALPWLPCHALD